MKQRVLILCTGNSCRSQMAEGLLRSLSDHQLDVESAGTHPSTVNPLAIKAMAEIGIDISTHESKSVFDLADQSFDWVLTVCDSAKESCPVFPGAKKTIHHSFDDPAHAEGNEAEVMSVFTRVRDEIADYLKNTLIPEIKAGS